MAVTIDEMQVDVKEPARPAAAPAPAKKAGPDKEFNLREAMQMLQQRTERLKAD